MSFVTEMTRYGWEVVIGFAFLSMYLLLVLWARSKYIASTNRAWTEAHVDAVRANVAVLHAAFPSAPSTAMQGVITTLLPPVAEDGKRRSDLHWNGAKEIGDWVRLHEVKRGLVWMMPDELVVHRFDRAMGQLDELPGHRQEHWKAKGDRLRCGGPGTVPVAEYRSMLVELLSEIYNARDGKYSQLASLYSKAAWLIGAALLPLMVLVVLGYGVVLIAGAIGGIISRLQRLVYAEGLPTAYGSSWVPLFCAPLLGALAAWAGLNLLALLQALGVVDLANVLGGAGQLLVPPPGVVGVAVLLGISERFLNRIGTETEKAMGTSEATAPTPAPPVPPAPAAPQRYEPQALAGAAAMNGNGNARRP